MARNARARRIAMLAWAACLVGSAHLPHHATAQVSTAVAPEAPGQAPLDPATVEQARTLFNQATALAGQGDWSGALARFRDSLALRPHAVTLYNVAYCERALGQLTRARSSFRAALAVRDEAGRSELPDDMAEVARTYGAELDRQIARVEVTLSPNDAALAVDRRPLERSAEADGERTRMVAGTRESGAPEPPGTDRFLLELDPGRHVFVLYVAGRPEREVAVELAAGSNSKLELALPSEARRAVAPRAVAVRATRKPVQRRTEVTSQPADGIPVTALVAFGVAAAATVGGAVTGTIAAIDEGELRDACEDKVCRGRTAEDLDSARALADISTASFIAAGGALVVGGVLWLLSDRPEQAGWSLRF